MSEWIPGPAWLFCPADRPDRYSKALAVADVVILDLEEAVAPSSKADARCAIRDLADRGVIDWARTVFRVNRAGTEEHGLLDLTVAIGAPRVMLSKAETVDNVSAVPHHVVLLLETPRGIRDADALAQASNVVGVMWGADDLVAGLGGNR